MTYKTFYRNNKYNAKKTWYNDFKYDSKFEASVAMDLDVRLQAGEIKDWENQYTVEMWAYNVYGEKALCKKHKVDFRIHELDGSYTLLEAKGVETQDYRDRVKWLDKLWLPENLDHEYVVVKQKTGHKKMKRST